MALIIRESYTESHYSAFLSPGATSIPLPYLHKNTSGMQDKDGSLEILAEDSSYHTLNQNMR